MGKIKQKGYYFMDEQNNPVVSVIVPIRRGEDVSDLVLSVKESTFKDTEIIIVDEGLERSAQRNIGISKAKGEYLLILDSDHTIEKGLISECVDKMNGFDSLYIPEKVMGKSLFNKIRNWERGFYNGTAVDVVRFVKKSICPMFDETMHGPEDSDWDRRIVGCKGITLNSLIHNEADIGLIKYLKKKAYYSKSMSKYTTKNPNDKVLSFWWRCFWVFLENGKWKRFLSNPLFALAVMGLIFLRGIVYIINK